MKPFTLSMQKLVLSIYVAAVSAYVALSMPLDPTYW